MKQITKLWLTLKFWTWAAAKSQYFQEFKILIEPVPIRLKITCPSWGDEKLIIRIAICEPTIITSFPWEAAQQFAKQENIYPNDFTDDVPF
jgi:hypothetical protein